MDLGASLVSDALKLVVKIIIVAVIVHQSFKLEFVIDHSLSLLNCQNCIFPFFSLHMVKEVIDKIKHNFLVPELDSFELIIGLNALMKLLDENH